MHFNRQSSRRDHVLFYLVSDFRVIAPKLPDREIAEAGFFPLDRLPDDTTPATRRRLAEIFEGARGFALLVALAAAQADVRPPLPAARDHAARHSRSRVPTGTMRVGLIVSWLP